jgi:hypothetical protein
VSKIDAPITEDERADAHLKALNEELRGREVRAKNPAAEEGDRKHAEARAAEIKSEITRVKKAGRVTPKSADPEESAPATDAA